MTTTPGEARPFHPADLGTLVIMPWTGKVEDGNDMPYLLACSRGTPRTVPRPRARPSRDC
ncbi:hypothetical protein GCM10020295_53710 [Streptomyces cinereospinus]